MKPPSGRAPALDFDVANARQSLGPYLAENRQMVSLERTPVFGVLVLVISTLLASLRIPGQLGNFNYVHTKQFISFEHIDATSNSGAFLL